MVNKHDMAPTLILLKSRALCLEQYTISHCNPNGAWTLNPFQGHVVLKEVATGFLFVLAFEALSIKSPHRSVLQVGASRPVGIERDAGLQQDLLKMKEADSEPGLDICEQAHRHTHARSHTHTLLHMDMCTYHIHANKRMYIYKCIYTPGSYLCQSGVSLQVFKLQQDITFRAHPGFQIQGSTKSNSHGVCNRSLWRPDRCEQS